MPLCLQTTCMWFRPQTASIDRLSARQQQRSRLWFFGKSLVKSFCNPRDSAFTEKMFSSNYKHGEWFLRNSRHGA